MPSMHLLSQFGLCLGFSTLVSQISASPVLTGLVNGVNYSPARITVEVSFLVPAVSKDTDTSTIQPDADGFSPACLTCHEDNEEPNADAIFNTTTEFIPVDQTPPHEDLLYVPPSKTIGEPATNVKRAREPPTETRDYMTDDFVVLRDHFPWYRPFRNDKSFAMALKSYAEGDPKPQHYAMAAGPVKMTTCWRREYNSQDRRDFKWVFERSFDWEAQIWDMDLDRDNPPNVLFIKRRRGPSSYITRNFLEVSMDTTAHKTSLFSLRLHSSALLPRLFNSAVVQIPRYLNATRDWNTKLESLQAERESAYSNAAGSHLDTNTLFNEAIDDSGKFT
ncbi:hypothetical protein BDW62DRAFT_199561 [Aspergillus aurantiobrunneus]